MQRKLMFVLIGFIVLSLLLAPTGSAQAQDPQPPPQRPTPLRPSQPTAHGDRRDLLITRGSDTSLMPSGGSAEITSGQPGLSYRYVKTFGATEVAYLEDGAHLNYPYGVGADGTNIWVSELWGNRALKYTDTGLFQQQIGTAGIVGAYNFTTALADLADVAVDPSGNTWVVDDSASHIAKFSATGDLLGELGTIWERGTDNAHFDSPMSIAFDGSGNIYVSDGIGWWTFDGGNQRVQIFDSSGSYLATIGETGVAGSNNTHLYAPRHIAIYGSELFIADAGNHRIQIFNISNPASPTYSATMGVSGVQGSDNAHLANPSGVAVDANYIYVADTGNNRVQVFNRIGHAYVATIGTGWGIGNYQFKSPSDVALDSNSKLYVSDFVNTRVQQFSRSGLTWTYTRTYGITGVPYLTDGYHYNLPSSVAIAGDGSIYVIEQNGQRLVKLNAAGTLIWTVGQPGVKGVWEESDYLFDSPADVAVDAAGYVYVADRWQGRVQIYDSNGTFYKKITNLGCPGGLTVAPDGRIYVADSCDQTVKIYDSNLTLLATMGTPGVSASDNAHFNWPQDVAVDSNGTIYVADQGNQRVQVFNASRIHVRTMGITGEWGSDFDHFGDPNGLYVDSSNRLFVADQDNSRIQVFDASGAYLTTIGGSWGTKPSQFRVPGGVGGDAAGNIYVADGVENHRIRKFAPDVPGWEQVNVNGFGKLSFPGAFSLAVFNNQLYAGANNWDGAGASIYRTSDGTSWSPVMTGGFGQGGVNPAVIGMVVFNNKLYAGTGWGKNPGQLWRTADGTTWNQITGNGMGVTTGAIGSFTVYSNALYAGMCEYNGYSGGAQIWRSTTGDSGMWSPVVTGGLTTSDNACVTGLKEFNGYLYAGVENQVSGAQVWRSATGNLGSWTQVNTSGFGAAGTDLVSGLAVFNGYLYVGTRGWDGRSELWRSNNGTTWNPVNTNGFGDFHNWKIESLFVFNGALYAGVNNNETGVEVWRSSNGTTWTQVNPDGFGDSNNESTLWSNETTVFNNSMYMGVFNYANGVEIWKQLPIFADVPAAYWASSFIERLYNAGVTGGCTTSPLTYCPGNTVSRAQMAIFLLRAEHGSTYTPPTATGTFLDVPKTDFAAPFIEQLAKEGITGGCGGGKYCPSNPVTRAQMAIFLLRAEHGSNYTPPAATGMFLDVPQTDFTAPFIEQLANEGITGGCGGGNYCPAKAVTRDQMAIFLVRTFNLP